MNIYKLLNFQIQLNTIKFKNNFKLKFLYFFFIFFFNKSFKKKLPLFANGYRYKIHCKKLPGKPDIVLSKLKVIINIHGCYWHFHGCNKSNIPKTRTDYWLDKLEDNKKRDFYNKRKLIRLGWKVIDIWECTLGKKNILNTFNNLQRLMAI